MQHFHSRASVSTSSEDIDDVVFNSPEMRFSGVLDISIWTLTMESMFHFFAKIHATVKVPTILAYIFSVIQYVQCLLAPCLIGIREIWPDDSVLTVIFRIAGILWQGVADSDRKIIISFVFLIIFIISLIFLIWKSKSYGKGHKLSQLEMVVILAIYRCILPVFLPHLIAGAPHAWKEISNGGLNYIVAVLCPIMWCVYIQLLKGLFIPRVLLENSPFHTWTPSSLWFIMLCIPLVCFISIVAEEIDGLMCIICPILNGGILFATGWYTYYTSAITARTPSNIFVSIACTGGITSIIQVVNLATFKIPAEVLICCIPVIFVIWYLTFVKLSTNRTFNMLAFCDECADCDDCDELMERMFKSKWDFLGKVGIIMEYWHPYIITRQFFEYGLKRWPTDKNILIFYGRVVSFFPHMNTNMMLIASFLAKYRKFSTASCIMQFRYISKTRQVCLTPAIKKRIDDVNSRTDALMGVMRRFWENILQKNSQNFWDDATRATRCLDDIEDQIRQMTDDYPNNVDVFLLYLNYVSHIKRDYRETRETRNKIQIIEKLGRQSGDIAQSVAIQMYPNLEPFMHEVDSMEGNCPSANKSESWNIHAVESGTDIQNQLDYVIQELTEHSKLGRVTGCILVLIIMTFAASIMFFLYTEQYISNFIITLDNTREFLAFLGEARAGMCYTRMLTFTHIILKSGLLTVDDQIMDIIAPVMFTERHVISRFDCNATMIQREVSRVKILLTRMMSAFNELDRNYAQVQEIYKMLFQDVKYDEKTLYTAIYQILIDCGELLVYDNIDEFVTSPQFARVERLISITDAPFAAVSTLGRDFGMNDYSKEFKALNEFMAFTILVVLLLITLPFLLMLFHLHLQSLAIAESFTFFPNTEIREIITRFGVENSKVHDDVTHVVQLSHATKGENIEIMKMGIAFLASFLPLFLCCLITYYAAQDFMRDSNATTMSTYTLYTPFTYLYMSWERILRVFASDSGVNLGFDEATRSSYLTAAREALQEATAGVSEGMWSEIASVQFYFDHRDAMPSFNISSHEAQSLFEVLVSNEFPHAIDLLITMATAFTNAHENNLIPLNNNEMLSMWYWYAKFSHTYRTSIYCEMVRDNVMSKVAQYDKNERVVRWVGICLQFVGCLICVWYLIYRKNTSRNSLRFYHYLSPQVVTQNHNAMMLIETGVMNSESTQVSFDNADYVLRNINQGVVITDRQMQIIEYNPAFAELVKVQHNFTGQPLIDVIRRNEDDRSWPDFIQYINEALSGRHSPQFSMMIIANLVSGELVHLFGDVICMTEQRASVEGEHEAIERVAIIFDDYTETALRQMMLEQEQASINSMLANVIPPQILCDLENGIDSISFVVQSVTIGQIRVATSKSWANSSGPFDFYSKVFNEFDKQLANFPLLCCARTCFDVYTFAGGLFVPTNRPEKHAEQAVRFALSVLSKATSLAKNVGCEVEITVGMHTGGPVAAGVITVDHPSFQIIGPVMEYSSQMMETGIPGQVQVTRGLYELIFSSGFHVQERGDVIIRGGTSVFTYLITPS